VSVIPTYRYRCEHDGDMDIWQSIHADALSACPHCAQGVVKVMVPPRISASALPNKGAPVVGIENTERRWEKDGDAYARLRADGLQPRAIDGAARLEQEANTRFEVQKGKTYDQGSLKEAAHQCADMTGIEVAVA
jgi:putative FmdB family regulatory protein